MSTSEKLIFGFAGLVVVVAQISPEVARMMGAIYLVGCVLYFMGRRNP
jgi:hypothetical protein